MKTPFIIALAPLVIACESQSPAPEGPGVAIEVAPLSLPGIVEATYSITVKDRLGAVVWTKGPLSSTQYGDGQGALSYVGPCDADADPHTVELVLETLRASSGALSSPADFVNPTIRPDGTRTPIIATGIDCQEQGDVAVRFDLTVMRSARQGFFDFAVEFDDVYCSAKLDCQDSLMLRADGTRGETAVLGFACTAGSGDPTYMYLSDVVLTCTGGAGTITQVLDVGAAGVGQQGARSPGIFQWAAYQDRELEQQSDYEKCFWNLSVGLDAAALAGRSCRITALGAASDGPLQAVGDTFALPTGVGSYPYIAWDVEVRTAAGALCTNNGLDSGLGVTTDYVTDAASAAALPPLTGVYRCGEPQPIACATSQGGVTATPTATGFTLALADASAPPIDLQLPAGYSLGNGCCAPSCCQ